MHDHSITERFWSKVIKVTADGCWLWTGCLCKPDPKHPRRLGYGLFSFDGRLQVAHRVSWQLSNGPIPDGLLVLHRCDNPPCVNPAHLFLGTHKDNMADAVAKGRARAGRTNKAKGSRHWCSKLSDELVIEIRRRHAEGGHTYQSLASEYGVNLQSIHNIVRRKTWTHI